jgi:hypothetical protein
LDGGLNAQFQGNCIFIMDCLLRPKLLTGCDTLEEMGSIVGVLKQQSQQTILGFKRVEEFTVLVVVEINEQFMIPHNTSIS